MSLRARVPRGVVRAVVLLMSDCWSVVGSQVPFELSVQKSWNISQPRACPFREGATTPEFDVVRVGADCQRALGGVEVDRYLDASLTVFRDGACDVSREQVGDEVKVTREVYVAPEAFVSDDHKGRSSRVASARCRANDPGPDEKRKPAAEELPRLFVPSSRQSGASVTRAVMCEVLNVL